jgi:hypothetical protein
MSEQNNTTPKFLKIACAIALVGSTAATQACSSSTPTDGGTDSATTPDVGFMTGPDVTPPPGSQVGPDAGIMVAPDASTSDT